MAPKGLIAVDGTTIHETDEAVLVDCGDGDVWFPKALLEDWTDVGDNGEVLMPEWLAVDKGVI